MPRDNKRQLSTAQINRIANMKQWGYTTSEIAEQLGVSTATIRNYLRQ